MLENEDATFEEITFQLGYEDVSAFRKIFFKHTGILPMKYKARYQIV
jgi:AraC-like DNA-binding protein